MGKNGKTWSNDGNFLVTKYMITKRKEKLQRWFKDHCFEDVISMAQNDGLMLMILSAGRLMDDEESTVWGFNMPPTWIYVGMTFPTEEERREVLEDLKKCDNSIYV